MKEKILEQVSEKDFKTYEAIRESGLTNMFDVGNVQEIAEKAHDHELDRETITAIMKDYKQLKNHYLEDDKLWSDQ